LTRKTGRGIKNWIEKAVWGVALAYGGGYKFHYEDGYPPVINDPKEVAFGKKTARALFGENAYRELSEPSTGGEDFAYYLKRTKGAYFRLGIRNEQKGIVHPLHSAYFDVDEDALPAGAAFMAALGALR